LKFDNRFRIREWFPDNLLDIIEMYEDKGETYDLSADGFVFSEPRIREASEPAPANA